MNKISCNWLMAISGVALSCAFTDMATFMVADESVRRQRRSCQSTSDFCRRYLLQDTAFQLCKYVTSQCQGVEPSVALNVVGEQHETRCGPLHRRSVAITVQ